MKKCLIVIIIGFSCLQFVVPAYGQVADLSATSPSVIQSQLEQQLADIEKQIADFEKQLTVTVSQKNTLANKIKQLKIKQQELSAQLKATTLKINNLQSNITVAQTDLAKNIEKEAGLEKEILVTIKLIQQKDLRPVILLALVGGLSKSFAEVQNYFSITNKLNSLVLATRQLKNEITDKKVSLENQKTEAQNLLKIKTIQNQTLVSSLSEQNSLLVKTKGLEANYSAQLADKKKQAAEIRSRIYELFNTGSQINFGQAVDIATWASKLTGVRAAFLLAILTQESNLGKNVGTCNRSGDPPEKSWKVIMKPERDQEPFKKITNELGLDIDKTPVSCPMKDKNGKQIGWGGAMGPAQFIPSTWMGYKDKVSTITGKSVANPWDIRDAFIASAVKLKAGGAGTVAGEWKAAMIYFSGSTNPAYSFYGDNVVATANKYQQDIDELNS